MFRFNLWLCQSHGGVKLLIADDKLCLTGNEGLMVEHLTL
jgi:hypothetical protein